MTPPKQILKLDATLVDSNCVPSALIYFGPGGEASEGGEVSSRQYLKDEIMSKLSSPEAASFSASKTRYRHRFYGYSLGLSSKMLDKPT